MIVILIIGIIALCAACVAASILVTNWEWREIERLIEEWKAGNEQDVKSS